ncbi:MULTISPECIES: ABC transporter ATP-binding protein [Dehalobacter]|jgi:ABC-2 type transport system ATP-binding protein|uniref:ABC transporter n=1 Tax=Dehalobacter restrictus (strain DSM 9455 / PER-K23) TaxID=871738 RepID=A0ABM5P4V0_DEHRP|nr:MULTISPECIES: ABC transporter ATP-binding protein [Dehalobacter]AHF09517.1 ABC transporter [Dehalobacter restrictus DSM 9455]MCG1025563.1 ABC transporter ATP-binding protein [Dehalobacter sp.]MDJ0306291.1 ABC transporter ATP-binding protein [Dehalobacter sp.]OCZ54864.1 multidrug ABC transporter ATP-binding protein [Dehalobacter sp. TeCB1]
MTSVLVAENVSKGFFRNKALHDLDLQIEEGKVYGLLGPNGSGKTTFFKIAAGLFKPTSGRMTVMGYPIGAETKKLTAFMPTDDFLFGWMKIDGILSFYTDMYEDFDQNKALEYLTFMELQENMKVSSLSTGMKARLKLAVTMARKARLYLLDEPLNGIDPISREKIVKMIMGAFRDDCAVIISSHLVSELETILDEVIFLDRGTVVLAGDAEKFRLEKSCSIEALYKEVYHG